MHGLANWPQEFREKLVDESTSTEPWRDPEQGSQDTSKSSRELPWSREQKWNRVRVSTAYTRTFRRTQIVISA